MPSTVTRAGRYSSQSNDCKAFVPAPLPPTPEIDYDGELRTLLSNADRDIGRLDAIAALLPNHAKTLKLLDHLFQQPLASPKRIAEWVGCSHPTAVKLALDFQARGWLKEVTGFERNRAYRYQPYTELFHRESVESAFEAQHGLAD